MLAQRMSLFSGSGTAKARAAAKAAAANGKEIVDLSAGEIWGALPQSLMRGAISAIERGENRYTDTVGLEPLRQAIAKRVSLETGQVWGSDEIAVTAGAKQALFNAAMVTLNAGDEVLIPSPHWTTFPAQIKIAGGAPVFVDTRANRYVPRIEDLRGAVTPRTRAVIVNTPNNPTGAVYDRTLLAGIAELAIRRKLWVVFDECYGVFAHEPNAHEQIVSLVPEVRPHTLLVNAFSKQLAVTGWRLGYLAGPKEVIGAVKALQSHTTSNPNVIAQHAVLAHLESTGEGAEFEAALRKRLGLARTIGLEILSRLERVPRPAAQGGFYFYLDLSQMLQGSAKTADEIAHMLLAEAGVAAVSGTAFGDPTGLRLSYGIPLEKLEAGLMRLVAALNGWTGN